MFCQHSAFIVAASGSEGESSDGSEDVASQVSREIAASEQAGKSFKGH